MMETDDISRIEQEFNVNTPPTVSNLNNPVLSNNENDQEILETRSKHQQVNCDELNTVFLFF